MPHERAISRGDEAIASLATRPHGIFTTAELEAAGVARASIVDRVRAGRLHRLHRGVYSIVPFHLQRVEGRWIAAVRACGDGAALSHRSAAALWEMRAVPSGPVHVSVPTTAGRRRREGIGIHRSSTLGRPGQMTVRKEIPVTTPARTLSDLRRTLPKQQYLAALRRAERRGLDTGPHRYPDDPEPSEIERRMLALCRRHSLPLPLTQQIIGPYTIDFLWPLANLIVETDGWEIHRTRSAFESDRSRDAWLTARGYRVVRFTWGQLTEDGPGVAQTLRRILGLMPRATR
jgi:very-short-patch-repair endonuclease